ncbi:MAG: hypothetical protein LBU04_00235 [Christensenellaceae bacterium]|jgi:hypothetical protein|nr:hypothetical protein [Christensenellaceae bacterium]
MEDIEDLLLQIEEELDNGKKSFFGSGVTVDADVIYNIIDKIRHVHSSGSQKPRGTLSSMEQKHADDIIKAQNIVLQAQQRAEQILGEHNIVYQAQREAESIKKQANDYRARVLSEVKEDVNALLTDTQRNLADAINAVNRALKNNNSQD